MGGGLGATSLYTNGDLVKIFLTLFFLSFLNAFPQELNIDSSQDSSLDTLSNYVLFEYINSLSANDYNKYLDSIKNNTSDDFFSLRMAYTKTKDYSPYSIEDRERHSRIENFIESENYESALVVIDSILNHNFIDIMSHIYSNYIYDKINKNNESIFHKRIYNGLLESILWSGDGKTNNTAFIVVNTKEEYIFLNWSGLKFKEQNLIFADDYAFDLMKTNEENTNDEYNIYFNITLATNALEKSFKH